MKYIQLKQPDLSIETNAGWCLWETQEIYHVAHLYRSAWEAWEAAQLKHFERAMPNVSVPCYFEHWGTYGTPPTYGNWGHIVAYVPNVGFISSPANGYGQDIFTSLEDIERTFNCKFVGWSEDLSGELIIKEENKMSREVIADETTVRLEYNNALGRNASAEEVQSWVGSGATVETLQRGIQGSPEHYQFLLDQQLGVKARTENWEQKIKDSESEFIKVSDLYIKK